MSMDSDFHRVPIGTLRSFVRDALASCGVPEIDADSAAELITEADLTGVDTHGIFRLPQYVSALKAGAINPTPRISCLREAGATAVVDGDNGLGHLAVAFAARKATELARNHGVGWVGIRQSNHAGAGSIYAAMPVRAGMVGLYAAVSGANFMAPWGGAEALLGTNPIAFGIPAGEGTPVILDMATSVASFGAIKNHALQGKSLPVGWVVDRRNGQPLTDATQIEKGILLPIGGYKGSGLALVIGLLAGVLNGAAFGQDLSGTAGDVSKASNTGQLIVALDIRRFLDPAAFAATVRQHLDDMRQSERLPGIDEIRIPGDERERRRHERLAYGVPVSTALVAKLNELSDDLHLRPLSARRGDTWGS
jgi:L-2-hydroxycarboxylate dehydrogenase (NAD+)